MADSMDIDDQNRPTGAAPPQSTSSSVVFPSSGPSQMSSESLWANEKDNFKQGDIVVIDEEIEDEIEESRNKMSKLSDFDLMMRNCNFPKSKLFKFRDLHQQFDSFKDSQHKGSVANVVAFCLPVTGLYWVLTQSGKVKMDDAFSQLINLTKSYRVGTQPLTGSEELVDFVLLLDDKFQLMAIAVLNQAEAEKINQSLNVEDDMRRTESREITVQVILKLSSEKEEFFYEINLPLLPGSETATIRFSSLFTGLVNFDQIQIDKAFLKRSNSPSIEIQNPAQNPLIELHNGDSVIIYARKKSQQQQHRPTADITGKPEVIKPLCFEKQAEVARRLFRRTVEIVGNDNPNLRSKFSNIKFLILTPNLNSLMEQTLERVQEWGFKSECVVYKYFYNENCKQEQHEKCWNLIDEAKQEENKNTLFVFVFDECHYANNPNGAHAQVVNDPELTERENVFMLLVSATPWNVLSKNSKIREFRHLKDNPQRCMQIVKRFTNKDSNNTITRVCHVQDLTNNAGSLVEWDYDQLENELLPGEDNVIEWWDWSANQSSSAQQPDEFEYVSLNKLFRSIVKPKSDRYIRQDGHFNEMIDSFNHNKFGSREQYLLQHEKIVKENLTQVAKNQDKFWTDELLLIDYVFSFLYFHFVRRPEPKPKFDPPVGISPEQKSKICNPKLASIVEQVLRAKFRYERDNKEKQPPEPIFDPSHENVFENSTTLQSLDQIDDIQNDVGSEFLEVFWKIILDLNQKWKEDQFSCNLEIVANFYLSWLAENRTNESLFQWTETDEIVRTLLSSKEVRLRTTTQRRGHMIVVRVVQTKTGQMWHDCLDFLSRVLGWEKNFDVIDDFGQTSLKNKLDPFWFQMYFNKDVRTVSYEDLLHLPCIIILVAKGRMGDTFPHSLRTIDLRLRHMNEGSTLSTVVQELGRLCRYVKKGDNQKVEKPYALISESLFKQLKQGIEEQTGKKKKRHTVHADRGIEYAQKTIKIDHNLYRIPGFDNTPKFTQALLANEKLMNEDGRVRKSFYRSIYSPSPSKSQIRKLGTSQSSYDKDNDEQETHPRRILLSAETQIGKTGAYLQFLHLLETQFSEIPPELGQTITILAPTMPVDVKPSDWENPKWHELVGENFSEYHEVKRGKYHPRIQLFRLGHLLEISKIPDIPNVVEQYANAIQFQEMICSNEGLQQLKKLGKLKQTGGLAVSGVSEITNDDESKQYDFKVSDASLLEPLISWDGRHVLKIDAAKLGFETPPQWNFNKRDGTSMILLPDGWESLTSMIWGDIPQKPSMINQLLSAAQEDVIDFKMATSSHTIPTADFAADQGQSLPKNYTADMRMVIEAIQSPIVGLKRQNKRIDAILTSSFQGNDLTLLFGENLIRVSIPENLLKHFETSPENSTILKFKTESSPRCIFIPSYNRPKNAKLHLQENMKLFLEKNALTSSTSSDYIEFVVIRPGAQFVNYFNAWADDEHIVFVQLPEQIDVTQLRKIFLSDPKVRPKWFDNFADSDSQEDKKPWEKRQPILNPTNGIGYSRLAIQLFSHFLGMKQIWMLDDNTESFHRLSLEGKPPSQSPSSKEQPQWCSMLDVMQNVENIFNATNAPKDKIGIMGIRRHWRNYKFGSTPFSNTHKTYSFIFLNVESTIAKNVLYPPKEVWEDIEFAHQCHDRGLLVVRCNKYFHDKSNFTPPNAENLQEWSHIEIVELGASASVSPPSQDVQTHLEHQARVDEWCQQQNIRIVSSEESQVQRGVKVCLLRPDSFDGSLGSQLTQCIGKQKVFSSNNPNLEFLFQLRLLKSLQNVGDFFQNHDLASDNFRLFSTREKNPLNSEDKFDCFIIVDFRSPRSLHPQKQTRAPTIATSSPSFQSHGDDDRMIVDKASAQPQTETSAPSSPLPSSQTSTPSSKTSIKRHWETSSASSESPSKKKTKLNPNTSSSSVSNLSHQSNQSNLDQTPSTQASSSNMASVSNSAAQSNIDPSKPLQLPAPVHCDVNGKSLIANLVLKGNIQQSEIDNGKTFISSKKLRIRYQNPKGEPVDCAISEIPVFNEDGTFEKKRLPQHWQKWKVQTSDGEKSLENWKDGPGFSHVMPDKTKVTIHVFQEQRQKSSDSVTPQNDSPTSSPSPLARTPTPNKPSPDSH